MTLALGSGQQGRADRFGIVATARHAPGRQQHVGASAPATRDALGSQLALTARAGADHAPACVPVAVHAVATAAMWAAEAALGQRLLRQLLVPHDNHDWLLPA
jgi:hypothetical protein